MTDRFEGWPVTDDRSAVLLIRVWLDGEGEAFRARLTAMGLPGDAVEETTVAVAASPSDVVGAVEEWLAQFVDGPEGSG